MRLIDADKLKQSVINEMLKAELNSPIYCTLECVIADINNQPTAYDVDNVVRRLEEYARSSICNTHEHGCPYLTNNDVSCANCGAIGALEIVKSCGVGNSD